MTVPPAVSHANQPCPTILQILLVLTIWLYAHRDNRAQAILEEVFEGSKGIIRALSCDALPKSPAHVHIYTESHDYEQRVTKLIVAQQNESSLHMQKKYLIKARLSHWECMACCSSKNNTETQASMKALHPRWDEGPPCCLGRQIAPQQNADMHVQFISTQPDSCMAELYLRGVVSSSGCCNTSDGALTRQSTNQGIHNAFCSKSYLQHGER